MLRGRRISCAGAWLHVVAIGCLLAAAPVGAQDKDAVRRVQQQMQKLQQTNSALEREKADLVKKLAEAEKKSAEVDALKSELVAARRDAVRRTTEIDQERASAQGTRERMQAELATASKAGEESLREIERLRTSLKQSEERFAKQQTVLAERERSLGSCAAKNQSMARSGSEILDRLSNGTCAPAETFSWDPLFQIGRLRFEAEIEAYRDKLADDRYLASPIR